MPAVSRPFRAALVTVLTLVATLAVLLALGQAPAYAATTGTVSGDVSFGTVPVGDDIDVHLYPAYPTVGSEAVVTTDAAGHYEFTGVPFGNYVMSIWGTQDHMLVQVPTFALTSTSPDRIAHLVVPPFPTGTSSVFGTITDASTGLPIDGANANFDGNSQAKGANTFVGPDGVFDLTGLPGGDFSLSLSAPGYVTKFYAPLELSVGESLDKSTALLLADSSLTGHLEDAGGDPVADLFFQLRSMPDGTSVGGYSTDASGDYAIHDLGAGDYKIEVGGLFTPWVKTSGLVSTSAASPGVLDLTLTGRVTTTVRGNINNATGVNLAGICTELWNMNPDPDDPFSLIVGGGDETDASGNFTIPDVDAGTYTIMFWDCSARDPAFATTFLGGGVSINSTNVQSFTVTAGVDSPGHDINLKLGASISGHINLLTGDGVGELPASRGMDATIYQLVNGVWEEAPDPSSFVGNGDVGDYTANGLPAGTYRVGFADRNSPPYLRYQEVYWPTAGTVATATGITVVSGQRRLGVNATVTVTPPVVAPAPAPEGDLTGFQEDVIDAPDAAQQGALVTISVGADHAGEWVSIWGHSTPTAMTGWVRVGKTGTVKVAVPGSMVTGDHKVVVQNASNGVLGWSELGLANGPYPVAEPGSITVDSASSTLLATFADWPGGTTFSSYQWYRGATAITGATGLTYTLQAADAGKQISFKAGATVPGYSKTTRSSTPLDYSITKTGGSLTISGVARFEQTLNALDTLQYAALGSPVSPTVQYQWLRAGVAIPGATGPSYQLVAADLGKAITVRATASMPGRVPLATTSAATALVGKGLFTPVSTPPAISLDSNVPLNLFADVFATGVSNAGTYKYQWYRAGVAIPLATTSNYLPGDADWGKSITVKMTMSRLNYDPVTVTFAPRNFSLVPSTAVPVITGEVRINEELSVEPRTYTGFSGPVVPDLTYQWLRNGVAIPGATNATFTPVAPADLNKAISVRVTATDTLGGSIRSISTSAPTQLVRMNSFTGWEVPLYPASTTGPAKLTAPGSGITPVVGMVTAYQWLRGGVAVAGATTPNYTLTAADHGKQVRVRITVSAPTYTTIVKSSPPLDYSITQDSIPTVTASAWRVGVDSAVAGQSYLTKDGSLPTPAAISYQWLRNGVVIAGATQSTRPIVAADYNTKLSLRITVSQPGYVALVYTTAQSPLIAKGETTGSPGVQVIMTTPGKVTASLVPGTLTPASPAPVLAYKWYRANPATPGTRTLISGATAATYPLVAADYGKLVSVQVTMTRSNFTVPTTALPVTPGVDYSLYPDGSATPTISGQVKVDAVLTASTPTYHDGALNSVPVTVTYTWYRNGIVIAGQTAATFTVRATDLGARISVKTTATQAGFITFVSPMSLQTVAVIKATIAYSLGTPGLVMAGGYLVVDYWPSDTPGTVQTVAWYRGATPATGFLGSASYLPVPADYGYRMHAVVQYTKPGYDSLLVPSSDFNPSVQRDYVKPTIIGNVAIGQELTYGPVGRTYTFENPAITLFEEHAQWFRNGVPIPGSAVPGESGTASHYTLSAADLGKAITVRIIVTSPDGYLSSNSTSAPTTLVVKGTIVPGAYHPVVTMTNTTSHTMTVSFSGTPTIPASGGFTPTYKWYREGVVAPISTASSYNLIAADTGKKVTVVVTLAKSGFNSLTLAPVLANGISQADDAEITGGTSYGDLLTCVAPPYSLASTDAVVSGSNGTISYQWFRGADAISASPISGATLSQYTVDPADENTNLYCDVTVAAPLHATLVERTAAHFIPS